MQGANGCFPGNCGRRRKSVDLSNALVIPSKSSNLRHKPFSRFTSPCTLTHAMASQKHVAEVPRSLLPRLSWNSSTSRSTASTSHHPALVTRQRQPSLHVWSPFNRQIYNLETPYRASRAFSTSIQNPSFTSIALQRISNSAATHPANEPHGNPVRHNGVYVATFKPAKRAFHSTPSRLREHHFDTLKFVKRLQAEGFSEEQAVAMMRVLNDIIQESIQNLTRTMVLREGWSVEIANIYIH